MADFLTHIIFCEDVLDKLKNNYVKSQILKRRNLYYLGSQGPDIFFYYQFWHAQNSKAISKIAHIIHRFKTADFFKLALLYSIQNNTVNFDLLTYAIGYICHYCLDKNVHPYICYITEHGVFKEDGTFKKATHQEIESVIDVVYMSEKKALLASKFKLHKLINYKNFPICIEEFYTKALRELYHIDIASHVIKKCIIHMHIAYIILYDSLGIKNYLINLFKIKSPKPLYTKHEYKNTDWLNRKNRQWHHLLDANEKYNYSFDQLYNTALEECATLINSLLNSSGGIDMKKAESLFDNRSYITNKPCDNYY